MADLGSLEFLSAAERELIMLLRSDAVFFVQVQRPASGGDVMVAVGDRCDLYSRVELGAGPNFDAAWAAKGVRLSGVPPGEDELVGA